MIPNLDRVPTPGKANRVKITQDDGTVVEGVLAYADDATQEGSAVNKAKLDQFLAASGETAGTSTNYTLDQEGFQAVDGVHVRIKFHVAPGKRPKLNVNNTGSHYIKTPDGLYLYDTTIQAGAIMDLIFNQGFYWIVGKAFDSVGEPIPAGSAFFSSSGTFNPTTLGLVVGQTVTVQCVGGGAGGGRAIMPSDEAERGELTTTSFQLSNLESIPVTIGTGGTGSSSTGGSGGTTSFGNILSAAGGSCNVSTGQEYYYVYGGYGGNGGYVPSDAGLIKLGDGGRGGYYYSRPNKSSDHPAQNGTNGGGGGGASRSYTSTIGIGGSRTVTYKGNATEYVGGDGSIGGNDGGDGGTNSSPFGGAGATEGNSSGGVGGGGAGYGASGGGISSGSGNGAKGGNGYKGCVLVMWEEY